MLLLELRDESDLIYQMKMLQFFNTVPIFLDLYQWNIYLLPASSQCLRSLLETQFLKFLRLELAWGNNMHKSTLFQAIQVHYVNVHCESETEYVATRILKG